MRILLLAALAVSCGGTETAAPVPPGFAEIAIDGTIAEVTAMAFLPGTDELLVLSRTGRVEHHRVRETRTDRLGGFTLDVHTETDCGLISLAFDPAFDRNHFVYVGHCTSATHSAIGRITFDATDPEAIPSSYVTILELGDDGAEFPFHNVGSLAFDSSGALLALFGDKSVPETAQDPTTPLGGVVRLFPSRIAGEGGYTLPVDVPYAAGGGSPLLYAVGVRSPWKGFVDERGRLVFGDVGAATHEEVNVLSRPGTNFGWPLAEGPCRSDCEGLTDPVVHWDRSESHPYVSADPDALLDWPRVAWVARGVPSGLDDPYDGHLSGAILYGDLCVGFVRSLVLDDAGAVVRDEPLAHLPYASGWDTDPDGWLYAITFADRCTTSPTARYGESHLYRLLPR